MAQFEVAATGGTFDLLHRGHLELLRQAFAMSDFVIVGLTGDDFAVRLGKTPFHNYLVRFQNLLGLIQENFPDAKFQISRLDDHFGPAVLKEGVDALIVSEETRKQGLLLNRIRREKKLPEVEIVVVPMVLAWDGRRISSTRMRNSEVDFDGKMN